MASFTPFTKSQTSSYNLVEEASPGPYLELFARRTRLGWNHWGNQVVQTAPDIFGDSGTITLGFLGVIVTRWSNFGPDFLRDPSDPTIGDWAVGQSWEAPDRAYLRSILEELRPCSLLDVGCGTGIELEGLRQTGLSFTVDYTGIDITPEFVYAARSRYFGADFRIGSIFALPYPDGAYDVVSARAVLEHLEDGYTALERLWGACSRVCVVSWFIPCAKDDGLGKGGTDPGWVHSPHLLIGRE